MTSSYSNIWKRFLFNNQSTIYNNNNIEYHIQYHNHNEEEEDRDDNINDNNIYNNINIEEFILYHYDYFIMFIIFLLYYCKK